MYRGYVRSIFLGATQILNSSEPSCEVKTVMVSFEPSSIYGSRTGWQELLLVTASETKNMFHKSNLWKQGHVSNITMLPRSDMLKPPRTEGKYGSDGRFTRVQEMKQAQEFLKSTKLYHL